MNLKGTATKTRHPGELPAPKKVKQHGKHHKKADLGRKRAKASTRKVEGPKLEVSAENMQPIVQSLGGSVEDLFNPKTDVEAEFGISEAQLNVMARQYKSRNASQEQASVPRHRSFMRKDAEEAEESFFKSFQNMASSRATERMNSEDFATEVYRRNIMEAAKAAPQTRRSKRVKKFVLRKN